MNVLSILCQRCGAPLHVADESVRFITCAHCATPLEIVRQATQSHSRILEQIQESSSESAKTLRLIALQNELEQLDRDWHGVEHLVSGALVDWKASPGTAFMNLLIGFFILPALCVVVATSGLTRLVFLGLAAAGMGYFFVQAYHKSAREIKEIARFENAHHQRRQSLLNAIQKAKQEVL